MTPGTTIPVIIGIPQTSWDLIAAKMELSLGRLACRLARANPRQAGFYLRCARYSLEGGWRDLRGHDERVARKQEGKSA